MRRLFFVTIILMIATVLAASVIKIHRVEKFAHARLYWDHKQAYVFITEYTLGWRPSYIRAVGQRIKAIFPMTSVSYDDLRSSTTVWRISNAGTEKVATVPSDTFAYSFVPFEEGLFADDGAAIVKWTGDRFIAASQQEIAIVIVKARHTALHPDFNDVNGWSGRYDILAGNKLKVEIPLSIDDAASIDLVVTHDIQNQLTTVSVQTNKTGVDSLFQLESESKKISKSQYQMIFGQS